MRFPRFTDFAMSSIRPWGRGWVYGFGLSVFLSFAVVQAEAPAPATMPSDTVTINFPNATVDQIIAYYSELTGRTAIRNANVQGRIVLQSNGPLTREDAIIAIQSVMTANQLSIVHMGDKFFKVVPSDLVKQSGISVSTGDEALPAADQMVSKIFQLKFVDVKDMQPNLQGVINRFGQIIPFPRTNTLLIMDAAANLIEIEKIINHLDRPLEAKVKSKFYPLKNAKAKDVVARIMELLNASGGAQQTSKPAGAPTVPPIPGQPEIPVPTPISASSPANELVFSEEAVVVGKVTLTADERTNQIILLTRTINFPFFDQMIEKLDADTAAPLQFAKIAMKYADAEDMANLLNELNGRGGSGGGKSKKERVKGDSNSTTSSSPSTPRSSTPSSPSSPSIGGPAKEGEGSLKLENLVIYPDPRTNSLILLGTSDEIKKVRDIVKDVDVILAQVLLEGIIVEVTLNRTDSFGVEVLARAAEAQFSQAGLNNTLSVNPVDALSIVSPATLPNGLASGLNYFASLRNSKVDILVQALAQNSNVKILSQPVVQTSHNEEARIVVGEARPVVTQTATDITGNLGTLRSSFAYKDIALELYVRPLVNPDGLVVLDILQKVNSISGFQTIDNNQIPIISRREANSVVSVQDGSMVVLGGLVGNNETVSKTGIPLLSDIPLLGYLFSNTRKERVRTELMVLLKPTVLRTPEDASEEAKYRREMLQSFRKRTLADKLMRIPSLNEQLDNAERPRSLRAQPADPEDEVVEPQQP